MTENTTIQSGSYNTHARFAPSDSKRWTTCSAAVAFQEANKHRIPEDTSSGYSNEGTEAHDWAAKVLTGQLTIKQIPAQFQEAVGLYVDHCLSLVPEGVSPMVEVEVPLFYQATSTGTCDFAVLTPTRVVIRDLKYGAGVLVEADENTQLAIYAMSLIRHTGSEYPKDTIIDIGIFQPRHREAHSARPWVITLGELEKFCWDIEHAFIRASEGTERVRAKLIHPFSETRDIGCDEITDAAPALQFVSQSGDSGSCRWCKAKAFCDKRMDAGLGVIQRDFISMMPDLTKEEKKLPVEERLAVRGVPVTDEFLVQVFAAKNWIEGMLDDVAEYLETRALAGQIPDGTKIVYGRQGNRKWANEEAADTFLKNQGLKAEQRYEQKLIGPAEAEKLLADTLKAKKRAASRFSELVIRSDAKKVLALASDKREAVPATISVMPDVDDIENYEV